MSTEGGNHSPSNTEQYQTPESSLACRQHEIPESLRILQEEQGKYKRQVNWIFHDAVNTPKQKIDVFWPYYGCQKDPYNYYNNGVETELNNRTFFKLSGDLSGYVLTMTEVHSESDGAFRVIIIPETRETKLPIDGFTKTRMRVRSTTEIDLYHQLMKSMYGSQGKDAVLRNMQRLMHRKNDRVADRIKVFEEFLPETHIVENATSNNRLFRHKLKQVQDQDLEKLNEIAILQHHNAEEGTDPLVIAPEKPDAHKNLIETLQNNPQLRDNLAKFIDRCKRYYRATGYLPEVNNFSLRYDNEGTLLLNNIFGEVGLINDEGKKQEAAMGIQGVNSIKTRAENEIDEWNMGLKNIENLQTVGIADEFGQAPVLTTIEHILTLESALQQASEELGETKPYKIRDIQLYQLIWGTPITNDQNEIIGMDTDTPTELGRILYQLNGY